MSTFTLSLRRGSQRTTLPPAKKYIDAQLHALDISPIPQNTVAHKQLVLLNQAMEKAGLPFTWTAAQHRSIMLCFELAAILLSLYFIAAVMCFLVRAFGFFLADKAGPFLIDTPILIGTIIVAAFTDYVVITVLKHLNRMRVPYWGMKEYEDYLDDPETPEIPIPIMRLVRELRVRLQGAEFTVHYLAFTTDPFLEIKYWENRKWERRFIAQWG